MFPSQTTEVVNADSADHPPSPAFGSSSLIGCSICLDLVIDNGQRSIAKLHCGHRFHLDCIGSAFNTKGAMQCPNCRRIESGRWLFGNGTARAGSEAVAREREWVPHEGPHEFNFPQQPIGFQWRPLFVNHPATEEAEASIYAFANILGNYAAMTASSAAPPLGRSHVSYFRPNEHVANSNFHHPLNAHPPRGNAAPVRSTRARAQPVYQNPRPVSRTRETPVAVANSQSRQRSHVRHVAYHQERPPSEVTVVPLSPNGFVISGGALAVPVIVPNAPGQPHNGGVPGVQNSETETDESSDVPIVRGSYGPWP